MTAPAPLRPAGIGSLAAALKLIAVVPVCGFAQQAGQASEEIVVTAGFRKQDLMDSPGSTTVVDARIIDARAAQHLESVLNASPNSNYSGGASRARFVQIRGVGDLEQFVDPKHFPAVGIMIDDIDLGGIANAGMLFDVEQVEVARGPQATRFGTSALAGMVNIRGNRPTESFEGYGQIGAGNYGGRQAGGVVSGPVSQRASVRLAAHQHTGDGYIDNVFLGERDTNGYDETTLRATLAFDPGDAASYGLNALYFDSQNGYDAFSLENSRHTLSDEPGRDNQDTLALAARGAWRLGESTTLEAVTTWLDSDLEYGFDEDWTFVGICDGTLCDPAFDAYSNTDNYRRARGETSLDVRVSGRLGLGASDAARYVLGAYAQQRDETLHRQWYGDFFSFYRTDRKAVYGQLDAIINDRLRLTAGLRFEDFADRYRDTLDFRSASDDDLTSGEVTLAYAVGDAALWYATLARGAKAGGINTEASASLPLMQPVFQAFMRHRLAVRSEALLNREVGLKGTYLDGRAALRAAVFHMDRDDAQLESWMWDGVSLLWVGFLDNVAGINRGIELETTYQLSDRVQLFGAFGWLDAEVDEITTYDLDAGQFVVRTDIDQAKAPRWQYYLGADVALTARLSARLESEGRDDSPFGYYHDRHTGGYALLNASLRYRIGRTELQLWARNLTNQDYAVHGLYFGNDPRKGWINETYYQYGEPRVFGVTARHSF